MTIRTEVIQDLLRIQAVQINTDDYFTWKSGLKSPIYCDNRLTISEPSVRKKITCAFTQMIETFEVKPDVIAGCATAGIPHAAWLADALDLPLVYVRSSAKGHGKQNQIEGNVKPDQRVVLIEDLISTGSSAIEAAQALCSAGVHVQKVLAIFTYNLTKADVAFQQARFPYETITHYDALAQLLEETNQITVEQKQTLINWRRTIDQ